jgi:hypothetical protein
MSGFSTIKSEVLALVIDTPTAVQTLVGRFVNRAIRKLEVKHNFKVMEAEVTYTTTAATRVLGTRPTDWKQPRRRPYYIDEDGVLHNFRWISDKGAAIGSYGDSTTLDTGAPRLVYEDDLTQEFLLFPYPDSLSDYTDGEYRITIPYWKFVGDLIADGDTNWFTENTEQWIIYQAVAEAFYANEDESRAQLWEVRAMKEFKDAVMLDKDRRYGETQTLVYHIGALPPHTEE